MKYTMKMMDTNGNVLHTVEDNTRMGLIQQAQRGGYSYWKIIEDMCSDLTRHSLLEVVFKTGKFIYQLTKELENAY